MILISEFCDKTFFLAAVLSMRSHNRDKIRVFLGSIIALTLMSILSVVLGGFIFTWIPMLYTKIASTLLFFVCSVLMVREAMLSQPSVSDNSPSGPAFSSSSVHMEREQDGSRSLTSILSTADDVGDDNADDDDKNKSYPPNHGHLLFSKSFILTFIAEWGDRSQLATIALATSKVCFFLKDVYLLQ